MLNRDQILSQFGLQTRKTARDYLLPALVCRAPTVTFYSVLLESLWWGSCALTGEGLH